MASSHCHIVALPQCQPLSFELALQEPNLLTLVTLQCPRFFLQPSPDVGSFTSMCQLGKRRLREIITKCVRKPVCLQLGLLLHTASVTAPKAGAHSHLWTSLTSNSEGPARMNAHKQSMLSEDLAE